MMFSCANPMLKEVIEKRKSISEKEPKKKKQVHE
jgi:hypothetical protein